MISQEVLDKLNAKICECEDDMKSEEDFMIEDVPTMIDGIKWFVQEWLPNHAD